MCSPKRSEQLGKTLALFRSKPAKQLVKQAAEQATDQAIEDQDAQGHQKDDGPVLDAVVEKLTLQKVVHARGCCVAGQRI
jgi:hypothetical protein